MMNNNHYIIVGSCCIQIQLHDKLITEHWWQINSEVYWQSLIIFLFIFNIKVLLPWSRMCKLPGIFPHAQGTSYFKTSDVAPTLHHDHALPSAFWPKLCVLTLYCIFVIYSFISHIVTCQSSKQTCLQQPWWHRAYRLCGYPWFHPQCHKLLS